MNEKRTITPRVGSALPVLTAIGMIATLLSGGVFSFRALAAQAQNALSRAHIVVQRPFPKLDGTHLTASIVDVRYAPGESSPRHSHPCPPIAYLIDGAVRVRIKDQAEAVYKAGESFYEAPNEIHEVTQNISSTDPARLVAFFVCDHETPLTIPINAHEGR